MTDPFTIIGSVSALCNIVDGISRAITTIGILHDRWKNSDIYFLSLASQLVSLRAALCRIQEWMDTDTQSVHHQLTMDLDVSIACCKLLVDSLDLLMDQIDRSTDQPLDVFAKLKLVFGTGGIDELQKHIERQTNALNLLLSACNL